MTDIIVPSELIVALKERYPSLSSPWSDDNPIRPIVALLPAPPKVGEVLDAAQIRSLPNSAVMRDEDGDVLIKVKDTVRRVTTNCDYLNEFNWTGHQIDDLASAYTVTLVSLPKESSK